MFPQRINGVPDGIPETQGNLGKILVNKVVAKLANNIVARGLPLDHLHEEWPDLYRVNKALVCWLTEIQNSFSANSPDAKPSASRASRSSGVPANPGRVRCSTAVRAASTTSSTDW